MVSRLLCTVAVLVAGLLVSVSGAWAAPAVPPPSSAPQIFPLALDRLYASDNGKLDIDGHDDQRVDVDVAVIDTGIQLNHPDLNIAGRTNCTDATWPLDGQDPNFECTAASPSDGDDDAFGVWHGSQAAANIAALDNGIGVVGIAAGARLWSVDVSGPERYGNLALPLPDPPPDPAWDLAQVIAGVKWVTAHADEIEVAHIAVACIPDEDRVGLDPAPICIEPSGVDLVPELQDAIAESIAEGVVYTFTAGALYETDLFVPQRFDDILTSSFVADSDGLPGGLGNANCGTTPDDSSVITNGAFYSSSWGPDIDIASIGCGGSRAAAHVTAAAAILASADNPDTLADVQQISADIVAAGNDDWTDNSTDGVKEPMLDLSDQDLFDPVAIPDEDFYITDTGYDHCDWAGGWTNGCIDTGYTGQMEFVNHLGVPFNTCTTTFNLNIDLWGTLNLQNLDITNCADTTWGKKPFAEACGYRTGYPVYPAAIYDPGQLTWPGQAPPTEVKLEIPICYGIGNNDYVNRVVFNPSASNGQRVLTQNDPPDTNLVNIDNATLTDTNSTDNVRVIKGTP
jgi:hypothetical protein